MSKQFSGDSEESNELKGTKGKSQAQLLVLLLLVAVGAYIYFFTGLIKPREEASQPQPQQPAQVKKPMPPRQAEPQAQTAAKPDQPVPVAAPAPAASAPVSPATTQTAGKQKPAAVPAPTKAESVKAAKNEAPAPKKLPVKEPAAAGEKPVAKKVAKEAAPAKAAEKAPAPVAPKSASAAGKTVIPTVDKQQPERKRPAGAFSLKTADIAFADEVASTEAKLKKVGLKPVRHKLMKQEPMNRLFYAEYPDRQSADTDLEQLHAKVPDAFIIQENGKYAIYAGSYLKEGRAAIEQDRLFDKGIRLVMKKSNVKIPVTYLTAGSFASTDEARKVADKLKKSGIAMAVVKTGAKQAKK
ncbi:SPOR domain-containing protein [Geotalea sp. SG265]|uniref:SPOR domain-containing protein n=1 Tax=Geotalea sp. SG265 TaxID=2922867 RepID=UPI001FAEB58D|nr:SPOR domain-containing protein [Geotalea sp. SG265]